MSKRLQLIIPDWLYKEVDRKAKELGMTVSEFIRESIRQFIQK